MKINKRCIVNADDFGISHEVNEAIKRCFKEGYISNTTLLVNMQYADEAVSMAKENGFFDSVGLHLNLTQGKPLTQTIKNNPLFVDGLTGEFNECFHKNTRTRLYLSSKQLLGLKEEIEAQMRKYTDYGLTLKHLDSHHHIHTDASIFSIIKPLVNKYGFRSIRLSKNISISNGSIMKKIYKKIYNKELRNSVKVTTAYFGDFDDYLCDNLEVGGFVENDGKTDILELMCHPILVNGRLLNLCVENENSLYFESFKNHICGVDLISYKEIN